ncbi:MAG: phosphoribosyltransferase regulatory subunit [Bacillota bacterium]|nr:phosphoribosyltransferase regulatory subunit [Bacillota bacterium]MDK2925236.1 phosphoribosyltransferase regulatory subunit [Bacillota bacterium]
MEPAGVQLPQGVHDSGPDEAELRRELADLWSRLFDRWGYREVVPPTFEFYTTLASGFAGQKAERLFRFFDRQGRILALRPDFTTPIARLAATKLADEPRPLRLWYFGSVFRVEERHGYRSEFTQAGVELIGAAGPAADAEVVALAVTALNRAGVEGTRVSLGHTGFLRALLAGLELTPGEEEAVVTELTRRNLVGLRDVLGALNLDEKQLKALAELPHLFGGPEKLAAASRLAKKNRQAEAALDDLATIGRLLGAYGLGERVSFDLGLVRELDYYTGMVFEVYVPGFGYPLGGGGRYDGLTARFGLPGPATGFALGVERVLSVRERQGKAGCVKPPDVLVVALPGCEGAAVREALRRRAESRVELATDPMDERGAVAYARVRGIGRIVLVGNGVQEIEAAVD